MSRSVHEPFCLFAAIIAAVSLLVGIPTASPGQEVGYTRRYASGSVSVRGS